jgi:hypothetical protein
MANYSINNFVNIPASGQTLDSRISIYNATGKLAFTIDPNMTTFVQKSKYVYIVVQNNIVYEDTLDFTSTSEAIDALVKLNEIKSLYINGNYNGEDYYLKGESDNRYYTKTYVDDNLFNKVDLTNSTKSLSLSALTIGNINVYDALTKTVSGNSYIGVSETTVGGISSGDTFNNSTNQQMWDKLLNPYLNPVITLTSNISPNIFEIGTSLVSSSFILTWNTVNNINVIPNSVSITGPNNNSNISEISIINLNPNSSITTTVNISLLNYSQINQSTDLNFLISGLTSINTVFFNNLIFSWKYRIYYGTYNLTILPNTNNIISNTTINNLLINNNWIKEFADNRFKTWFQDGNGEYIYFCYPKLFGDIDEVPFLVGNFIDTGWERSEMFIETTGGYAGVLYYIYRKINKTFGKSIMIQKN